MLSLTADSDRFSSFILSLIDRGILKMLFHNLNLSLVIFHQAMGTYITGILDIGDQIDHESTGFTGCLVRIHML